MPWEWEHFESKVKGVRSPTWIKPRPSPEMILHVMTGPSHWAVCVCSSWFLSTDCSSWSAGAGCELQRLTGSGVSDGVHHSGTYLGVIRPACRPIHNQCHFRTTVSGYHLVSPSYSLSLHVTLHMKGVDAALCPDSKFRTIELRHWHSGVIIWSIKSENLGINASLVCYLSL